MICIHRTVVCVVIFVWSSNSLRLRPSFSGAGLLDVAGNENEPTDRRFKVRSVRSCSQKWKSPFTTHSAAGCVHRRGHFVKRKDPAFSSWLFISKHMACGFCFTVAERFQSTLSHNCAHSNVRCISQNLPTNIKILERYLKLNSGYWILLT